ncbi:MAG: hypothetical protein ACREC5_07935 [Thermoplasmata archaeon]
MTTLYRDRRGHSNVDHPNATHQWPNAAIGVARVRITGGAMPETVHALPPLALCEEEWRQIGYAMHWLPRPRLGRGSGDDAATLRRFAAQMGVEA